jgi:hypothetical protein
VAFDSHFPGCSIQNLCSGKGQPGLAVRKLFIGFAVAGLLSFCGELTAQATAPYDDAALRLQRDGYTLAMEQFVTSTPDPVLKRDGLVWLIAQYRRIHDNYRAQAWARQLLITQPHNPIAIAEIEDAGHELSFTTPADPNAEARLSTAKDALTNLPGVSAPRGMPAPEFNQLQQELIRALNAALGYAYYVRKDYVNARPYLRNTLASGPENPQYVYALAIADLYGKNPDETEGFRLLARAVNLTRGTPASQQLEAFARHKYQERGGTSADWDQYLAATRVSAPGPSQSTVALNTANPNSSAVKGTPQKSASAAAPMTAMPERPANRSEPTGLAGTPGPNIPIHSTHDLSSPGAPFSLGILIESDKTSRESRRAILNSLTDLVRRLREDDEAFLMSFSKGLVFEEDLTNNSAALENGMENIHPSEGTALYDAVAFSAGHLHRIARNPKRVLLVISDGENRTSQMSPLELSGELDVSGVQIYCIGLGASTWEDQYRLKALAERTGGQAFFLSQSQQFRAAAQQLATVLGIQLQ